MNASLKATRDQIASYDSQIADLKAELDTMKEQYISNMKELTGMR